MIERDQILKQWDVHEFKKKMYWKECFSSNKVDIPSLNFTQDTSIFFYFSS